MDAVFPFGFPLPTAMYLALYVVTLLIHVLLMSYVLAGTAYLAARGFVRRGEDSPLSAVLRDWMPLMLSAAITAGIAPLLFVQILYQQRFYTANLLLFYRWMSILPVLIVGFYALYLLKSEHQRLRRTGVRIIAGLVAFLCFGFIAWSWTENHLLSVQGLDVWQQQYVSTEVVFHTPELAPRLALWFFGTFPTMALVLAWQMIWVAAPGGWVRRTAGLALAGLSVSAVCGLLYYRALAEASQAVVTGPAARMYLGLALAGCVIQSAGWLRQLTRESCSRAWLIVTSVGLVATVLGVAVVRECLRISRIDMAALFPAHQDAASIAGMPVFLFFLVVNAAVIVACIRIVRGARPADEPDEHH